MPQNGDITRSESWDSGTRKMKHIMHHSPFKTHTSRRGTCWDPARIWANSGKSEFLVQKHVQSCLSVSSNSNISVFKPSPPSWCFFVQFFPPLLVVFRVCKPQDPKFNMASSLNEFLLKFLEVGGSRYTLPGPAPGVLDRDVGFCTGFPPVPAIPDIIHGCWGTACMGSKIYAKFSKISTFNDLAPS